MKPFGVLGGIDFESKMTRSAADDLGQGISNTVKNLLNPPSGSEVDKLIMDLGEADWILLLDSLNLKYESKIHSGRIYIDFPDSENTSRFFNHFIEKFGVNPFGKKLESSCQRVVILELKGTFRTIVGGM